MCGWLAGWLPRQRGGALRRRVAVEALQWRAMGPDRFFFPQESVDAWIAAGRAELWANQLTLVREARRYKLIEAVLVQREVSGSVDVHELTGRVKTVPFLNELGAELLGASLLIGDNAYDVTAGFLGLPMAAADEDVITAEGSADPVPDATILAEYLERGPEC